MSINIFKGVELSIPKLRESLKYACAGDQFLAGTKNIWWLFFCVDCLPVLGQVTLLFFKVCEAFGKGFPIVQVADALFIKGTIFYYNRNPRVMQSPTFVARNKDLVLGS